MHGLIVLLSSAFLQLGPSCEEKFYLDRQGDMPVDVDGLVFSEKTRDACCSLIKRHIVAIGTALEQTVCFFCVCPFPEMS